MTITAMKKMVYIFFVSLVFGVMSPVYVYEAYVLTKDQWNNGIAHTGLDALSALYYIWFRNATHCSGQSFLCYFIIIIFQRGSVATPTPLWYLP